MENIGKKITDIDSSVDLLHAYNRVNINNYVEVEEYIYYIDPLRKYKLYKICKYSGKEDMVINYNVENIFIKENEIFYTIKKYGKIMLNKCDLEGKGTHLICKNLTSYTAYCVEKGMIYYSEKSNYKNHIKSMPIQCGKISVVYESMGNISDLYYFNDYIYYKRTGNACYGNDLLRKLYIGAGKVEDVAELFYKDVYYYYSKYIVYMDSTSDLTIIKDLETGEKLYEMSQCNKILGIFNKHMFFTYEGVTDMELKYVENMLYVLDVNEFSVTKLTNCNVCKVQMIGKYIYYKIKENDLVVYRKHIDGGDLDKIQSSSNKRGRLRFFLNGMRKSKGI
ncbi:hypothetical protein G9F71_010990 [Clostridium sp. FP2]|uniref:hypothetical protein n=1 Tax=Clostridium sp. FP2 TaxID=2724481 RepID=UPI0013E93BA6|nr:hypothetical protein [Clostridium sp. FP2]MBZ9623377.1 hypothetical protein [Clostridium sp. FP2]